MLQVAGILFLVLFLGVVGFLLLAPLRLEINSPKEKYQLTFSSFIRLSLNLSPDVLALQIRIGFWEKRYHIFELFEKVKKGKTKKKDKPEQATKHRSTMPWRKMRHLLNSFQVKIFHLNLDTDDYILNAYLFPVFHFLQLPAQQRTLTINYQGKTELVLTIQNRGIRLLRALLKR